MSALIATLNPKGSLIDCTNSNAPPVVASASSTKNCRNYGIEKKASESILGNVTASAQMHPTRLPSTA